MQFTRAIPFQEAIDKLGERSVIGSKLKSGEWAEVPLALHEPAYFSSTVESVRVLQRGNGAISDYLAGSRHANPYEGLGLDRKGETPVAQSLHEAAGVPPFRVHSSRACAPVGLSPSFL